MRPLSHVGDFALRARRILPTAILLTVAAAPASLRADSTAVLVSSRAGTWTIPWSTVTSMEVATARRSPWVAGLRGGVIGLLIGLLTGGISDVIHELPPEELYGRPLTPRAGAALGAGIGVVIGLVAARERWTPVALARPNPTR